MTDQQHAEHERELELAESKKQAEKHYRAPTDPVRALPDAEVFIWHGRGRDDVSRLADAIVRGKLATEVFAVEGRLHHLSAGQLAPLNRVGLHELVGRNFVGVRVVADDNGGWRCERFSLSINSQALDDLTGALLLRAAQGPAQLRPLPEARLDEIRQRVAMGEVRESISRALGVSLDVIPTRHQLQQQQQQR
jgi:hypothetical protein